MASAFKKMTKTKKDLDKHVNPEEEQSLSEHESEQAEQQESVAEASEQSEEAVSEAGEKVDSVSRHYPIDSIRKMK